MAPIAARPAARGPVTARRRIAGMQAAYGNAALGRTLARLGAEAEHLAGADRREEDVDEARVAQSALTSARAATSAAVGTWQGGAALISVQINAVTAIGGQVLGPPLTPFLLGGMLADGVPADVAGAFAGAAGDGFLAWADSLQVPGLPWYPSFAAFPGPSAPPTPNVPTALSTLGGNRAQVSAGVVAARIIGALGARAADPAWIEAAASFGNFIGTSFALWSATTLVTNVLGTGPVPSFATGSPGPVVGGTGTMAPGGFLGPPFGGG